MSFLERAKQAAGQAAKVSVDVGGKAARAAGDVGGKAAKAAGDAGGKAAATLRDPTTKARAGAALRKAKHGFTTALERIDPRILADVVVKATSLQERANASLQERGSAYRIGEIVIGASIPPSIQFAIQRVDDPHHQLADSTALIAKAKEADTADTSGVAASTTIVTLDGTEVDDSELDELDELEDEE